MIIRTTRRRSLLALVGVLAAALITPLSGSAAEGEGTQGPPVLDLTERPFVIFSPVPPKPRPIAHYPLPDGADDYWDLFEPDAPWQDAADKIDVFAMHSWMLRYSSSDRNLRRMFAWLDEHDIAFGLEMEPLEWPGPEVCDHSESFEGPYDMQIARKVKELGGTIALVSLDEPFINAHLKRGPRACGYSVEQVVDEVAAYRDELRELFPDVVFGSIEAVLSEPYTTPEDMATWLDTFAERSGEPFAFLNIDVDWRREGWQESVRGIEAVADERGVPFGMLYLGSEFAQDSETWLGQNAQHMATYEQEYGGTPDIVGIYSWHDRPDRVLPDDDPAAFTALINRYFGLRTTLQTPTTGAKGRGVTGRLTSVDGEALPGRSISAEAFPLDGTPQLHVLRGVVPENARAAEIGVRVNTEGGVPARADVRIHQVSYRENGRRRNRVPDPRFKKGSEAWAPFGEGSITLKDGSLRLKGKPSQEMFVNGARFKVTPGADFEFSAVLDVPEESFDSGYIAVMFIDEEEIERQFINFRSKPIDLLSATTNADGVYRVATKGLDPGRYEIRVDYDGNVEHWAARAETTIKLR